MAYMNPFVLVPLIIAAMVVLIVGMDQAKNYFLSKEQIKANSLVKVEEIKARNQLEMEKLVRGDHSHTTGNRMEFAGDDRKVREKQDQ
jgi:hypothetical protein